MNAAEGGGAGPETGQADAPEDRPQPVKRRPFRQAEILHAAVALFDERGYHGTNMADIGAAIGITGPGIYRHFPSKQAILETALREAGQRLLDRIEAIASAGDPPRRVLEHLVANYVDTTLESPALSTIVLADQGILSEEMQRWGAENLRIHSRAWVDALSASRPELTRVQCRALVIGAFSMAYTMVPLCRLMEREQVAATLRTMCTAILWADKPV